MKIKLKGCCRNLSQTQWTLAASLPVGPCQLVSCCPVACCSVGLNFGEFWAVNMGSSSSAHIGTPHARKSLPQDSVSAPLGKFMCRSTISGLNLINQDWNLRSALKSWAALGKLLQLNHFFRNQASENKHAVWTGKLCYWNPHRACLGPVFAYICSAIPVVINTHGPVQTYKKPAPWLLHVALWYSWLYSPWSMCISSWTNNNILHMAIAKVNE